MPTAVSKDTQLAADAEEWISFDDYLARDHGENVHTEWVNGRVVAMAPISDAHNELTVYLTMTLGYFVRHYRAGTLRQEPFVMKTGPSLPGRSPDLLILRPEHADRLHKNHLAGPADLVIEVISPDSRVRDREEKFREYEQGGVTEYWLIDPEHRRAEFYRLGDDGIYRMATVDRDGHYHSAAIPSLWIDTDWLWTQPDPDVVYDAWAKSHNK